MKIFNLIDYPNFLDYIHLTSPEIFNSIKFYSLEFFSDKNNDAEWNISFPIFLGSFYKYIYLNNKVLTQDEFYKYYLSENKLYFEQHIFSNEILNGLKARIYRTYPSLIRDLHFSTFLKENCTDALIVYNRKLDVEEGIDLLIEFNKVFWGINLYTKTYRAQSGRDKKVNRHIKFDNIKYIDLPVDFKECKQCGRFFLYGDNEFKEILTMLHT